jgi:hypothetical protein
LPLPLHGSTLVLVLRLTYISCFAGLVCEQSRADLDKGNDSFS